MYIHLVTKEHKINLIKAVRTSHGISLKEAKDVVEDGCFLSDAEELAFFGRCIPEWVAATAGDLSIQMDAAPRPGMLMPPTLYRVKPSSASFSSAAPVEESSTALASDLQSQKMVIDRLLDRVDEMEKRLKTLEDAPPKIIERVTVSEESAW